MQIPVVKSDAGRSKSKRPKQKNDCTVRAVALAYSIPYDEAFEIMKGVGRKNNDGLQMNQFNKALEICKYIYGKIHTKIQPSMSFEEFAQTYPGGPYIIILNENATIMYHGGVIDHGWFLKYKKKLLQRKIKLAYAIHS